jgi:hypothetical protein
VYLLSLTQFDTAASPFLDTFPAAAATVEVLCATTLLLLRFYHLDIRCELLASLLGGIWLVIAVMRAELIIMNQLTMLIPEVVLTHVQVDYLLLV